MGWHRRMIERPSIVRRVLRWVRLVLAVAVTACAVAGVVRLAVLAAAPWLPALRRRRATGRGPHLRALPPQRRAPHAEPAE
ncbi:hypothetical protein ITP53_27525 [Nonomuraea sp. K274]|uniref:Uncharacterized protein n=1 Tax=Nonomuraea cypriaca TaxID=1187855 RepID=A0A931AFS1_9ACTN|nr:hypothetical protein [Nonomuraea cypriaca]MBF8189419.1 hypothetical protein [Nonomuraea cypriaca]